MSLEKAFITRLSVSEEGGGSFSTLHREGSFPTHALILCNVHMVCILYTCVQWNAGFSSEVII